MATRGAYCGSFSDMQRKIKKARCSPRASFVPSCASAHIKKYLWTQNCTIAFIRLLLTWSRWIPKCIFPKNNLRAHVTVTDQAAGTSRLPVFTIPLEGDILHRWARLKGSSSELRGLFFWRPFYPAPVPWGLNEYALLSKQCRFLFWDAHRQQEMPLRLF